MITFIHTADWQIGKPFGHVNDPENRTRLRQERIAVIDRIGEAVRKHQAGCVLVAGDLFDSNTVDEKTLSNACSAIGRLEVPVVAIPGNHDHGGEGSIWKQKYFRDQRDRLAPNLIIPDSGKPHEIEGLRILPAPLNRRQESRDTTAWIRERADDLFEGEQPTIILAHGSVADFSARSDASYGDDALNRIQSEALEATGADYIALGDWHGTKQISDRTWYSGTPEQDRFGKGESNQPGHVLVVSLEKGKNPRVERVPTGHIGWHDFAFRFDTDDDLTAFREAIADLLGSRSGSDLLRLTLTGNLSMSAGDALETELASLKGRLLELRLDQEVIILPDQEEIDALAQDSGNPLIARVAASLSNSENSLDVEERVRAAALRRLFSISRSIRDNA